MKPISNNEAKELMLNILKCFADYCEKHCLRYYLDYGTLLGAIRHGGYIPWDDDIDVTMPRPDYEAFRSLIKIEKINEYLDCPDYDKIRAFPFLKLSDNRTVLKEHFINSHSLGIHIDIFPLDGMPDDSEAQRKIENRARFYKILFNLANSRFNTGSSTIVRLLKNLFYPFSRLLPNRYICYKLNAVCKKWDYDTSNYVGNIVWGYLARCRIPANCYGTGYHEFEGNTFHVPSGADEILTIYYDDYLQLPPEEKRTGHPGRVAAWK